MKLKDYGWTFDVRDGETMPHNYIIKEMLIEDEQEFMRTIQWAFNKIPSRIRAVAQFYTHGKVSYYLDRITTIRGPLYTLSFNGQSYDEFPCYEVIRETCYCADD